MSTLATLAELKTYIKIATGSTGKDTFLQSLLDNGEKHIESLTNLVFASTAYKELYTSESAKCLYLDHYPIIALSVFSTDVDHENLKYTVDIVLTQLMIDLQLGRVSALSDNLISGYLSVYVEYTAGYASATTAPKDLKQE